jgi:hypothetical protein
MRWGALFWAAVFIVMGGLLLLDNLGFISVNIWALLPAVMLIFVGVWVLLATMRRHEAGTRSASIPLQGDVRNAQDASISMQGVTRAAVRIRHGAGRLTVGPGAGPGELARGTFVGGLAHHESRQGDTLVAELSVPTDAMSGFPWMWGPGRPLDWSLELTREIPLTLDLEVGANDATLNLESLRVTELRLKTGASNTTLTLPAGAGLMRGRVEAGAAALNLRLPLGVGGRFRVSGLTGTTVDNLRFTRMGDAYQTADFDSAVNKVDIEVTMGAGSVDIR